MKSILLAIALMLCSTSVFAKSYYYDDDGYYHHKHHHNKGVVIVGPDGIYFQKGYKHQRKYKRCWERHGRTYCKYYYRDRGYRY